MAAKTRSTVVGVFEDRRHADQAVADLKAAGFRDDQIGVAMRGDRAGTDAAAETDETYAEEGAATGLVAGLGLGALAGIGVLAGVIPVVGPAIAGGTLGILLSNAAAGAAAAGLAGALIGWGIPEEDARYYNEEFEAGRTIVTVRAGRRWAKASAILRRHGAYDRDTGRPVAGEIAAAGTAKPATSARGTGRKAATIQAREERLRAEKRPVKTGEVAVRKEVRTEVRDIEVPVEREEIFIERAPVRGRAATGAIGEAEEIRIPVHEEQVRVRKEPVVTEEVRVGKRRVRDTQRVSGRVRKEEVAVERQGDVTVRGRGPAKGEA